MLCALPGRAEHASNWTWPCSQSKIYTIEQSCWLTLTFYWNVVPAIHRKRNMTQYAILNTKKVSGNAKRQISSSCVAQQITNRPLNRGLCDWKKDVFFLTSFALCTVSVVGRKLVHWRKSWEECAGWRISINPPLITPFDTVLCSGCGLEEMDSFT